MAPCTLAVGTWTMLASISRARIVAGSVAGHGPMVAGSTAGAVASPAAPIAIDCKETNININ